MKPSGAPPKSLTTRRLGTAGQGPECGKDSMFIIKRRNRFWEVVDPAGILVCITVYKRGAMEVVRRLDLARCAPA